MKLTGETKARSSESERPFYVSLGVPAGLTWLLPGARPSCIHLGGKKHTFTPGQDVECGKHIHFSELQSFRLDLAVNLETSAPQKAAILTIRTMSLRQQSYAFPVKWEAERRDWPVRTALAEGSARSKADLPSVFRMFGSAPCWSNTRRKDGAEFTPFTSPNI